MIDMLDRRYDQGDSEAGISISRPDRETISWNEYMRSQGTNRVGIADLRRRCEALQKELSAREAAERDREALAAERSKRRLPLHLVNRILVVLPALTAVGALVYTGRSLAATQAAADKQYQLAESGQITDRFNAAVTNLGSSTMTIRLGGIYALQRIMRDSPSDQPALDRILTAFIRSRAPIATPASPAAASTPAVDTQAALTVLATRAPERDEAEQVTQPKLDARGTVVSEVVFSLRVIDLGSTELNGAALGGAVFANAFMANADLTNADLSIANLTGADLTNAILRDADLHEANLQGANLQGADLTDADLTNANLSYANLADTLLCAGSQPTEARATYKCTP